MLNLDLKGKKAFVAGVGDDQGYGWAIAKKLYEAGAEVILGTWPPIMKIFTHSLKNGKFDESRKLEDGSMLEFSGIYPLDATFDNNEDIPDDILSNKRYKEYQKYSIAEAAEKISDEHGKIDILIHALANGPEVKNPLLETSRKGYLAAVSASSYSFVSLVQHFGPHMKTGGACLSLTYIASEKVIPGYGGGMSSAKAALESDTRTLAWEAGQKWNLRINTISAGPLASRAAKAIGFIGKMIKYSYDNAPLKRDIIAEDIGGTAAFLSSSLASGITGTTIYVDNGLHAMGSSVDSPALEG